MKPAFRGLLVNTNNTNLSIDLEHLVPRASARMRRGAPYARTSIMVPARGTYDLVASLGVTVGEAHNIVQRTATVACFVRRGLLKVY